MHIEVDLSFPLHAPSRAHPPMHSSKNAFLSRENFCVIGSRRISALTINPYAFSVMKFGIPFPKGAFRQAPKSFTNPIRDIEAACGRKAEINLLPMQDGDVYQTFADIEDISRDLGFAPTTPMSVGIPAFVKWYLEEWSQHPDYPGPTS